MPAKNIKKITAPIIFNSQLRMGKHLYKNWNVYFFQVSINYNFPMQ